jgi:L-ascorbate metabolism protein UlaG (beta-lactamase superfamily)
MKITKYEHSCLDITAGNSRLVIDPGKFSTTLTDFSNINAIVITHIHSDHFNKENVAKIINHNPQVKIFTTNQVRQELNLPNVIVVAEQDEHTVDNIKLKFYGGKHEFYENFENICVMVNDILYHPGDSYTVPDNVKINILATPASAPWLRVLDAVNFIKKCRPVKAFPIHNAILSEIGESIHYRIIGEACKEINTDWQILKIGESIEVS